MKTSTTKVVTCLDIGVIVGAAVSCVYCSLKGLSQTKEMNRRLYEVSILRFNVILFRQGMVLVLLHLLNKYCVNVKHSLCWNREKDFLYSNPAIKYLPPASIINSLIFYGLIPQSYFAPYCFLLPQLVPHYSRAKEFIYTLKNSIIKNSILSRFIF